jgi:prophage regulatory protein
MKVGRSLKDAKFPRRLLSYRDLKATRGIIFTRSSLARLEATGKFPKRVNVGEHHIAWVESEIDDFLEKIIAERG